MFDFDRSDVVVNEFQYERDGDREGLFAMSWHTPQDSYKAIIQYVHGYAGYIFPELEEVLAYLATQGFLVVAYEHEGHGRSPGLKAYVPDFTALVDDVIAFAPAARAEAGRVFEGAAELPMFLMGESMGGGITFEVMVKAPGLFRGHLLMAPMLGAHPSMLPPKPVIAALRCMARCCPRHKGIPEEKNIFLKVVRDPAIAERMQTDEANYHGKMRLGTGLSLLDATESMADRFHLVKSPFVVFHGEADTVTWAQASRNLFEAAASPDKTLFVCEDMWHGMYAEPDHYVRQLMHDVIAWIEARMTLPADAEELCVASETLRTHADYEGWLDAGKKKAAAASDAESDIPPPPPLADPMQAEGSDDVPPPPPPPASDADAIPDTVV
jgi:acylglycerol lipase